MRTLSVPRRSITLAALLASVLLVGACGQKGALYHPADAPATAPARTPADPAADDEAEQPKKKDASPTDGRPR